MSINRKDYWNSSYREYWMSRIKEKGAVVPHGDPKTVSDDVYQGLFEQYPLKGKSTLDVGCAWGRLFSIFLSHGQTISGVDISAAMIADAEREWGGKQGVLTLVEAEAEALPFESEMFDNVVCVAVFDATRQDTALAELLRVAKPGGQIYLTGKSTRYAIDDDAAHAAEIGARSKGHPNFFTDFDLMERIVEGGGHQIEAARYFRRRGDFGQQKFETHKPAEFYEYFVLIRKGASLFYSEYSETFLKRA